MSEPALTPDQLDSLEDALEDLEAEGVPASLRGDDDDARALADVLHAYRSILVLSREALPSEEVPRGLLDGVLAEARREAATPALPVASRRPWWRRLGTWGPALAFAGAAAVLLVLVRPAADEVASSDTAIARRSEPSSPAPAPAAAAKDGESDLDGDRLAQAEAQAPTDDPFAAIDPADALRARGGAAEQLEARRQDEGGAYRNAAEKKADAKLESGLIGGALDEEEERAKPRMPRAEPSTTTKRAAKKSTSGSSKSASGPLPGSSTAPAKSAPAEPPPAPTSPVAKSDPEPAPKGNPSPDGWAHIAQGDASRRGGSCGAANTAYTRAKSAAIAAVRARALAGLGLCALAGGDTALADSLFAKARAADAAVGKFIAAERPRHEPDQAPINADQAAEAPAD